MRICSPQLGISPQATRGGEVYDRETLTRLADLGVAVEILLPAGLAYPNLPNLSVTQVPLRRGYRWFVSNPLFVPYIGQVVRQRPFDLLRVHSLRFTGRAALWARQLFGLRVPVIAHHHHLDRDRWTNYVERPVARQCDLIITGSEFSRQQLIAALGVASDRVTVVPYGVSKAYHPLPKDPVLIARLGLRGRQVLLYLGSLKPRKNLTVLLRALGLLLQKGHDPLLVIVGRGPGESGLREMVCQQGLEIAVHLAGSVPEEEKLAWYNLADIFVFPSLMEGFGLAVAEAMACGKPVVASRAASLPEVVLDGETGILCNPHTPDDFAQAIQRLLTDPTLAERMGRAGAARVHRLFQWEISVLRTLELYEQAVE